MRILIFMLLCVTSCFSSKIDIEREEIKSHTVSVIIPCHLLHALGPEIKKEFKDFSKLDLSFPENMQDVWDISHAKNIPIAMGHCAVLRLIAKKFPWKDLNPGEVGEDMNFNALIYKHVPHKVLVLLERIYDYKGFTDSIFVKHKGALDTFD